MSNTDIGTSDQLKDPNYEIPLGPRTALGIQHVLAMFASNVTPSIIIAGAAGFAFGGEDMVFLV
ncbi:MAG TPA: uracil permease, partial [Alphaproteobacteria bacterium]|nr:uracil permease [Alphaproteobacteria bacterium]